VKRVLIALAAAAVVAAGYAGYAVASSSSDPTASCDPPSYDGTNLNLHCVVPQSTVTTTETNTVTQTATETVTATETQTQPVPGPTTTVTETQTVTVTPTPTTTPPPATVNCAPNPSACGYPDASNTGAAGTLTPVPAGASSGPGWHWDTRGWVTIDGAGAVFDGYAVNGDVDIAAANVTVSNSKVIGGGEFGVALIHTTNATITHCTIAGTNASSGRVNAAVKDVYGDSTGMEITGNNIYWFSTGVQFNNGLIADNYIHDPGFITGDHNNGTTSNAGSPNLLTIRHNTIFNPGQTDAVSLFEDFGAQHNALVDNNLLAGGSYTIYGGANAGGQPTSNIKITNNRIAQTYFVNGGYYGPIAAFDPAGAGNVWTGNVWDKNNTLAFGNL